MILSKRFVFIKHNMLSNFLTQEFIYWSIIAVPSILIASTIHEYAHGYAAFKLGDATAKAEGRLTLNPIKHIDPIGAISMILFKFGWSKPVPINEYNFMNRERDTALVAFAGPFSNLLLAGLVSILHSIFFRNGPEIIVYLLYIFTTINIALATFNLLPIPPLDGHKIVRAFLPRGLRYYWEKLEDYSIFLILLLIIPFSPLSNIIFGYINGTLQILLNILGF